MPFKKKEKPEEAQAIPASIEVPAEPMLEAPKHVVAPDATVPAEALIEVWERRFVNPGQRGSAEIRLNVSGMVVRWINTSIEGRYHRAVYDQGWQPVPLKLLKDPSSIPDLYSHPANIVCRGERGKEVLMMMPETVFERIRQRKEQLNLESQRKLRSEMAQAAAHQFGSEAGDFIGTGQSHDGNIKTVGSIQFGSERVPMGDA